jgi:hemolysin activation/secretion protein
MLRVAGQMADKNLDSSEKFSLTGPGGVRAYAAGDFAVDEGRYTDLQLRYNQPYVGGALLWSVFIDNGWGRINVNPLAGVTDNEVSLLGAGLGLQWSAGPDLGVNATLAWRSSNSPALGGWGDAPRLYLQLFKNL